MCIETDTDHSHYIDRVAQVLAAAGLTVAEYQALDDTHREAYIKLAPTTDPVTEIESSVVLTWHEGEGWRHGFTETHRVERGIQCLSELMCDDRYIETVALPTTVADALLKLTHTVPDDLDKALAAYLPADQPGAIT
jgi:hypothetical protein